MTDRVAFIFPGQGAQYLGMGRDFYHAYSEAKAVFDRADALLGRPLSKLIFEGSEAELTETKNSQLAIFVTSWAMCAVGKARYPQIQPAVCAGLSLGEYTALVAAGLLPFEEALALVEARGRYMQKACEENPGVMCVVLGLDPALVEEVTRSIEGVWVANLNCPGQVVLSGTPAGIEAAAERLKGAGMRRIAPLQVSGAFHSGLMQSAQNHLAPLIEVLPLSTSEVELVMNVSGAFPRDLDEVRQHLIEQVTRPVHWQKGIEAIQERAIDLFIEWGPGQTLAGMNRRIGVDAATISIGRLEELEALEIYGHVS